jgi:uncharacterized protein YjeT (DUF2065 family)
MDDLWAALGLVLVIEGVLYAVAPAGMKRMMAAAQAVPEGALRAGGLAAAILGVGIVWLARQA